MRVTPLHSALAGPGDRTWEAATLLIGHGADVNVAQQAGWTPLQQAAARGDARLVRFLIDHGAGTGARNASGHSALDLARAGHHAETVKLLEEAMEEGADA